MLRSAGIAAAVGALVISAVLPASGQAARRLSVTVAPAVVEPGDSATATLHGAARSCRLALRRDRRHARPLLHGRLRTSVALTIPAAATPGRYLATATCGRRHASARLGVHAPAGPDFSLALKPVGRATAHGTTRIYRVRASNLAPWAATSVRLCVHASGRRVAITGVKDAASRQSGAAACKIAKTLAPGHVGGFDFRLRSAKRRTARVAVAVTAANSTRATRSFAPRPKAKAAAANGDRDGHVRVPPRTRPRAHAAQALPACTPATRLGVAFVADDSGSMVDNDPDQLRGEAISVGLDALPDGSLAGASRFADGSSSLFDVSDVEPATRPALKARILPELESYGQTDYELGLESAQTQLAAMGGADRKAVIFLSDGLPTYDDYTADQEIAAQGVPIFTIGFGDADEAILADIAARSGGQSFTAASAGDLQSIFARIVAQIDCAAASTSTALDLDPGQTQTVPFAVGYEDGEFRALAAWSGGHLTVTAVRPDASLMTPTALRVGERFSDNPTYALLTGQNPQVGGWVLQVTAAAANASTVHVSIDVFKKDLPPLPVHPPLNPKTQGRAVDACAEMYGLGTSVTKHVLGGSQTTYDRQLSLFDVCAGFGTPEDVQWSLGMKCAFISAVTVLAGGALAAPELQTFDQLCDGTDTLLSLQKGDWAGVAAGKACNVFGSLFSEAAGVIAAGVAAESGPGALFVGDVVYRAFAAGFKLACGGLFSGGARTLGIKLEDKHEADVARDVSSRGKCLRTTTRFGYFSWSAADCPS